MTYKSIKINPGPEGADQLNVLVAQGWYVINSGPSGSTIWVLLQDEPPSSGGGGGNGSSGGGGAVTDVLQSSLVTGYVNTTTDGQRAISVGVGTFLASLTNVIQIFYGASFSISAGTPDCVFRIRRTTGAIPGRGVTPPAGDAVIVQTRSDNNPNGAQSIEGAVWDLTTVAGTSYSYYLTVQTFGTAAGVSVNGGASLVGNAATHVPGTWMQVASFTRVPVTPAAAPLNEPLKPGPLKPPKKEI